MKYPKKRIFTFAAAALVIGAGAAFAYHSFNNGEHSKPTKFVPELAENGTEIVVKTYRIPDASLHPSALSFTGTLQPRYLTPVGFRVAGKIAQRHVEVGAVVKQGDLLFSLDPTDYELNLRVAEADLVSAQSTVTQTTAEEARLAQLRQTNAVSVSEYDAGLANRDVSLARLDSAKKRLELAQNQRLYCELRADSDGLVTSIQGEAGQVVAAGQTVVQLMQGKELEAVVSIPETRVMEFRQFKPEISLWSNPGHRIPAELRELSPIADPVSRTFDARFRLTEIPGDLAIGMTATVYLDSLSQSGTPVPVSAIGNRYDKPVVWKINESDNSVTAVAIEIVKLEEDTALVRGTLQPGDQIVSAGVQRVDASVKVRAWVQNP